jgi:hypothetical protein
MESTSSVESFPTRANTWITLISGSIGIVTAIVGAVGAVSAAFFSYDAKITANEIAARQERLDESQRMLNIGSLCNVVTLPIPTGDNPAWNTYTDCVFGRGRTDSFWHVSNKKRLDCLSEQCRLYSSGEKGNVTCTIPANNPVCEKTLPATFLN